MIDIKRRAAFTEAFKLYPTILMEVVRSNEFYLAVADEKGEQRLQTIVDEDLQMKGALILMGQFFTRLMATRAANSTAAMEVVSGEMTDRYHQIYVEAVGGPDKNFFIDQRKHAALNAYEQGMAELVFEALAQEAKIIDDAAEEGNLAPDQKWVEADFWMDVFLSFGALMRAGHPSWVWIASQLFDREAFIAANREFPQ